MQKITTHLWFDREGADAAKLYTSVFPNSSILGSSTLEDTPSGSVDVVTAEFAGQEFTLLSAGPYFKFNPSISFHAAFSSKDEVDEAWRKLSEGGSVLMELGSYPFSERYGWLSDRYGLSWQLICVGDKAPAHTIKPVLMFTGAVCGKAEEAVRFYTSTFRDSNIFQMRKYQEGQAPNKAGTVQYAGFVLEGKEFGAMDSAQPHEFAFNEAISFMIHCETQEEVDYYWGKLSAVPESEQCGWLKDKYGISWQVTPTELENMLAHGTREQAARVTEAFLKMKKFDISALKSAYEGR